MSQRLIYIQYSAIVGFIMCLGPLSCDLMGFRGAGGSGAAGMYVGLRHLADLLRVVVTN